MRYGTEYIEISFLNANLLRRGNEGLLQPCSDIATCFFIPSRFSLVDRRHRDTVRTGDMAKKKWSPNGSKIHILCKQQTVFSIWSISALLSTYLGEKYIFHSTWNILEQIIHVLSRSKNHSLFWSPKVHSRFYKTHPETQSEAVQSGSIIFHTIPRWFGRQQTAELTTEAMTCFHTPFKGSYLSWSTSI
jgi:hypothetical protein